MSDIFYQYKILENPIELIVKLWMWNWVFDILNFYEDQKMKLSIKSRQKWDINTILPKHFKIHQNI